MPFTVAEELPMDRAAPLAPRWDQGTFLGRLQYFASITHPGMALHTSGQLYAARDLIQQFARGVEPPGTSLSKLHAAQSLCQSGFHPDTGELQNVIGRMSFQVYGGVGICAAMMIFYRSTAGVVFWQWTNQSFNALVNYTNRNAKSDLTTTDIGVAYVSATAAAMGTSLGLKRLLANSKSTLLQRFVPFVAVASANIVNIPLMRQNELKQGCVTHDALGNDVCQSRLAAVKGITLVTLSRVGIVTPVMLFTPVLMERLERVRWFTRRRALLNIPIQLAVTAVSYVALVPICCALFPQTNTVKMSNIRRFEPHLYEQVVQDRAQKALPLPEVVFYNKGL